MSNYDEKTLRPILEGYCDVVNAGLDERRGGIISKYPGREYQVVVGLMARQAELSIQLAGNVGIWNGGIPPLVLRCMVDCFIVLSWILEDVEKHSKMYMKNSYDRIERMIFSVDKIMKTITQSLNNVSVAEADKTVQILKESPLYVQSLGAVRQGLNDWGIKNDVCDKNLPQIKEMAECVGKNSLLYEGFFSPMSLAVHNNWIEVENILAKSRENPFACKVSEASALCLGSSAILISETYTAIDEKLELKCSSNMPITYWMEHFPDKYLANLFQKFENIFNNDKTE